MYFLINLWEEIPVSRQELPEYFRFCFQSVSYNICPNILYVDADADTDAGGIAIALLH